MKTGAELDQGRGLDRSITLLLHPASCAARGVARANDASGEPYHQPALQVPQASGGKKFALVCPGKNKDKVSWSQRLEGLQATVFALVNSPKPWSLPP